MIAYQLSGHDNGTSAYGWPGAPRCLACGYITDRNAIDPELRVKRRGLDVSSTYDNVLLVSRRFAEACRYEWDAGLVALASDPEFFVLKPPRVVPFDAARRGTRFEKLCPVCEQYESVVGANPGYLRIAALPTPDGFFRTDLGFGSGDEKSPLVIASSSVHARLVREFRRLEWYPVQGAT
jgi:hypothetical protein